MDKIQQELESLSVRKQGKSVLSTLGDYQSEADNLLKKNKLDSFLKVSITENKSSKTIRAYGKKPEREVVTSTFEINCQRNEIAIEAHESLLGWQVYATNAPEALLNFESCVWKYRYQSNIESRFDDLRNKIVPLLPVFLQKDDRIKGLVNILLLALKLCATVEYKVAQSLKKQDQKIAGLYEGNPRRTTTKPSIRRILKAFEGLSISLVFVDKKLTLALITTLSNKQKKILELMGLKTEIYTDLCSELEMFFSNLFFSET